MAMIPGEIGRDEELVEASAAFTLGFTLLRNFCAFVMILAGAVALPTQPGIALGLWAIGAAIFAL